MDDLRTVEAKRRQKEDEWFKRHEKELLEAARARQARERGEQKRAAGVKT